MSEQKRSVKILKTKNNIYIYLLLSNKLRYFLYLKEVMLI